MKYLLPLSFICIVSIACTAQSSNNKIIGGPCEGCEAIDEYGNRQLTNTATLPDFHSAESKLKISGTVFQKDGITPAENVILYKDLPY